MWPVPQSPPEPGSTPKIDVTDPRVKPSEKLAPLVTAFAVKDGAAGAEAGRVPYQMPRPATAR